MSASKYAESKDLIVKAFRDAIVSAISDASTLQWQVNVGEGTASERPDTSRSAGYRFTFEGTCSGEAIVSVYYDLLPRFAFRDVSGDDTVGQKNRLLSVLQEKKSQIEGTLSKAGAISIQVELVDQPALTDHEVLELGCRPNSEGDESTFPMFVCVTPKLLADLQQATAGSFVFPPATPAPSTANLDLVMDVELNVTLRFGQRQLALRDVLELASGSVVELDRQVDEPIELILDGKVVARGEAVIIDGNYGMRVTQVLQPLIA